MRRTVLLGVIVVALAAMGSAAAQSPQPELTGVYRCDGKNPDGTAYTAEGYSSCDNWTSDGAGAARVGHHDKQGGGENPNSWNSAHNSRGCSPQNLQGSGGAGSFYCFGVAL